MRRVAIAIAMLLGGAAHATTPEIARTLEAEIAADWTKDLRAQFEDFHRHPELGFQETRTAALMARHLRAIPGMAVTEKVGRTGVVGVLRNGDGPVVLLRADMDGLPVQERSGLPFASTHSQTDADGETLPTMHACGHDTHITGLIATARRLAAHRDKWAGTVVFVVQPAEETLGGAREMVVDGLYTRFPKPQYALAWHVGAGLETGRVSFSDAIQYSSSDAIDIIVKGVGAHGASPHSGKDPIVIGSAIVQALQTIRSREISPLVPAVVTVGVFEAGTARNIIPERAKLELTLRANDEETRAQLIEAVKRVATNTARAHGVADADLPEVIVRNGTPTTQNTPALAQRLRPMLQRTMGDAAVVPFRQQGMGAEDFAFFVERMHGIQGLYFGVGGTPRADIEAARNGGPPVPSHHSPLFKVDGEAAVKTGSRAMTLAALELLAKPGVAADASGKGEGVAQ